MTTRTGGRRSGSPALVGLLMLGLVVAALATVLDDGDGWTEGPAFDPRSTDVDGLRGLVLLLEQEGYRVREAKSPPRDFDGAVFAFAIDWDDVRAGELSAAAAAGATVVVTSGIGVAGIDTVSADRREVDRVDPGLCDLEPLRSVVDITVATAFFDVRADEESCLAVTQGRAAMTVRAVEAGRLIRFGAEAAVTNTNLDDADHAAVALGLARIAEEPGGEIVILDRTLAGSGESTLRDLLPDGVVLALAQLVVVAVVELLRRSRRLGRPVIETDAVEIDGSETVRGTGRLLTRVDDRVDALSVLDPDAPTGPSAVSKDDFVRAAAGSLPPPTDPVTKDVSR